MQDVEAGRPRVHWRSHPFMQRITGASAHLSAAVLLATGAVGSFAARRRTSDGNAGHRNHTDREETRGDRERNDDDQTGGRRRDRAAQREDHKDQRDSGAGKDGSGSGDETVEPRHRDGRRSGHDETSDIGAEARTTPTPTPTPTPKNDPSGGGGGSGGGSDGGNGNSGGHGNAGSNLFDRPLATKAGRRANDLTNQDGGANAQIEGVSFTSGPDGVEIHTNNIAYTAAPTPTPTPFPRLELPGREGVDPGGATITPTPATSTGRSGRFTPDAAATGNGGRTAPAPSDPAPTDTSGGDNTMDFTS